MGRDTLGCSSDAQRSGLAHLEFYKEISLLDHEKGVDYQRCSSKGLKRLIEQRGLKVPYPSILTLKYFYTPILKAADRTRRFRFTDLPPEIRNQICNHLLSASVRRAYGRYYPGCYPEILATNREINKDATGILYADSCFQTSFHIGYDGRRQDRDACSFVQVALHNQRRMHDDIASEWDTSTISELCAPSALNGYHKIGAIRLDISLYYPGNFQQHKSQNFKTRGYLQNMLLVFASALTENNRLKKIGICFTIRMGQQSIATTPDPKEDVGWPQSILYPLRRIRGIKQVDVTGDVPDDLANSIARDMQSDQPAFNTWSELQRVQALVDSYLEVVRSHHLEDFVGKSAQLDELLILSAMPPFQFRPHEPVVIDEDHEMQVRLSIVEQEKSLECLGPVELLFSRFSQMG